MGPEWHLQKHWNAFNGGRYTLVASGTSVVQGIFLKRKAKACLLQNCPNHFAAAASRASSCGIWWSFCTSDESDPCCGCVPANLACNPCHMSSRLPLNVPVGLLHQRLKKNNNNNNKRLQANVQDGRCRQLFVATLNTSNVLWCVLVSCVYSCKAGLRRWNPHARCPFHLTDKQEESRGGAGNKPPTPSPFGHGAFYIPPSISITISVSSPHARHAVDDSDTQRLSEEPAAAAEEADRRRYERSPQSSAAK